MINRKYLKYYEYIDEVVNKCSHTWLIQDRKDFRVWRYLITEGNAGKIPDGKLIKIVPARCKSYSCEICGRKKVYDLLDRIRLVNLKGYRFFTLTLKNEYVKENTEKNLQRISKCFTKLNNSLRKIEKYKGLEYFKVIEVGNNGMVHIHGIWNKYIDIKLLSTLWFKVTKDSYRTDVRRIKGKDDVVRYLYKYLTKNCLASYAQHDPQLFEMDLINTAKLFYENGKRRYSSSKNFFSKVPEKKSEYLQYGFESEDSYSIESEIKFLVNNYKLKKEHFDFSVYNESDEFIENYFDSS